MNYEVKEIYLHLLSNQDDASIRDRISDYIGYNMDQRYAYGTYIAPSPTTTFLIAYWTEHPGRRT